ncbi:ATP-binding protein [Flavobacterium sp. 3HN19-14]|uniref:ATP-binding protein n=1 Tax=Flavobacterium sp. 3HN19-14 TaxID=3448133 RepID=UPI003EDFBD34
MVKTRHIRTKIIFVFAMALLLSLSVFSYVRIDALLKATQWVNHTNVVKLKLENLFSTVKGIESAQRGFIITRDDYYAKEFDDAIDQLQIKLTELDFAIGENTIQQKNLDKLRKLIKLRIDNLKSAPQLPKGDTSRRSEYRANRAFLRNHILAMMAQEDLLLKGRTKALTQETALTPMFSIFLIVCSIAILFASYINITRNEKALAKQNATLEEKNKSLARMNKELESFTYISSHDLQEPLRKIQTFVTRITDKKDEQLSETARNYLNRTQESANRMQLLIRDLLAYSRLKTEIFPYEITNLKKIVNEVKSDLAEEIDESNAVIEVKGLADVNVIVSQFRQLLTNLISNAIKFSQPGLTSHIIIENGTEMGKDVPGENILKHQLYSKITISDNGIGFDPKYTDRIFNVFQRLHTDPQYKGTGIGLAIVKKIVDNHNGIVVADGIVDKGATFTIYIPCHGGVIVQ